MVRSSTLDKQSPNTTEDWFLESFRAARSGPSSFEFPELDNGLDESQTTETSELSRTLSPNPEMEDLIANVVNGNISESSFDIETPLRRPMRHFDALESPPRFPNLEFIGESPMSSSQADISRLPEYFAISPGVAQPHVSESTTAADESLTTVNLSEEDWEYLRLLCSYMDAHNLEEISQVSSYNMQDGRKAASALGVQEPSGQRLRMLLEIGLELYRFRDDMNPWSAAIEAKRQNALTYEHQRFISQRREENYIKATNYNRFLVNSEFFSYFKSAFREYRDGPLQTLDQYVSIRIRPLYFQSWRSRLKQIHHLEANSSSLLLRKRQTVLLRNLKSTLKQISGQQERQRSIIAKRRRHKVFALWQSRMHAISSMLTQRNGKADRLIREKYLYIWRNFLRLKRAQNILSAIKLRELAVVSSSWREEEKRAVELRGRFYLGKWRRRIVNISDDQGKMVELIKATGDRLRGSVLRHWRTETSLNTASYQTRRAILVKALTNWRLQLMLSQYLQYKRRTQVSHILKFWTARYRSIAGLESDLTKLHDCEELEIQRLTIRMMFGDFIRLRNEVISKVPASRDIVLGRKVLRSMCRHLEATASEASVSRRTRRRILSHRYFQHFKTVSEEKKLRRLASTSVNCQKSLESKMRVSLIRRWRRNTKEHNLQYENVDILSSSNRKIAILLQWKQNMELVLSIGIEARRMRKEILARGAFTQWSGLQAHAESMMEYANSYDTSSLASIFKAKLRRWQQQSSSISLGQTQARKLHEGRIRSVALSQLQDWQELVVDTAEQDSVDFNGSLASFKNLSLGQGQDFRSATPGKRLPMSPNRLQKWKTQNKANSSRFHDSSTDLTPGHGLMRNTRLIVPERSPAGTPTRPSRVSRTPNVTSSPNNSSL